jgi:hypothetical protein
MPITLVFAAKNTHQRRHDCEARLAGPTEASLIGRPIPVGGRSTGELTSFVSVLFCSDGVDTLDNLLPTPAHVLERGIIHREHEAGMDKAKARALINP